MTAPIVPLPQALGRRIDIHPTVDSLRPVILASLGDIERDARLPQTLVDAMIEAGIFRTLAPREIGGLELHPLDYLDLLFELARINASVSWIAQIQNGGNPLLEPEQMRELTERAGGNWIIAGSHGRIGKARRVAGGYRFTGHWAFASGAPWATYITAYARVVDDSGDDVLDDSGAPHLVDGILPTAQVTHLGNWNPMGMRGTASSEFTLDDVFVPDEMIAPEVTPEAYAGRPCYATMPPDAAVVLGIAQGMIDAFAALSHRPARTNSWANRAALLGQDRIHQLHIAEASSLVRSSLAWLRYNTQIAVESAESDDTDPEADYARSVERMQCGITAGRNAKRAASIVFDMAGSDSLIPGRGIESRFRDVQSATQHTLMLETGYVAVGQFLLTEDAPDGPVITEPFILPPPPVRLEAESSV